MRPPPPAGCFPLLFLFGHPRSGVERLNLFTLRATTKTIPVSLSTPFLWARTLFSFPMLFFCPFFSKAPRLMVWFGVLGFFFCGWGFFCLHGCRLLCFSSVLPLPRGVTVPFLFLPRRQLSLVGRDLCSPTKAFLPSGSPPPPRMLFYSPGRDHFSFRRKKQRLPSAFYALTQSLLLGGDFHLPFDPFQDSLSGAFLY